jgi:hypothetical protein
MANEYTLADEIEEGARDELPETFDALVESENFGPAALARRKSLVMARIWGRQLDDTEIDALDPRVQAYAAKYLARTLIGPGIDYWANQVITLGTVGAMQEGEMGTPHPYDFPPVYGPPEDNTATAG